MGKPSLIKLLMLLLYAVKIATVACTCTSTLSLEKPCFGLISCSDHIEISSVLEEIRYWVCRRATSEDYSYYVEETVDDYYKLSVDIRNTDLRTVFEPFSNLEEFKGHISSMSVTNGTSNIIDKFFYWLLNATNINLSHNEIETLALNEFLRLKHLEILNVSYNAIETLEADNGTNSIVLSLSVVDLSHNVIADVPDYYFFNTPRILHLNLSYNSIEHLDNLAFQGLHELQTLSVTNNKLTQIGSDVTRLAYLQELRLDFNYLTSLDDIKISAISLLKKLTVSNNNLNNTGNILQYTPALTELDLSHNCITNILKSQFHAFVHNLQCLDLSYNNITKIERMTFEGMNITYFKIDKNRLSGSLDNNTFKGTNSDQLDLSGGSINELGSELFVGPNLRLKMLNFSNNLISKIQQSSFHNLELLIELDLSNNKLQSIDFDSKDLKNLAHFYSKNNFIKMLTKNMLANLVSLQSLDVSHNAIESIDEQAFINLKKLEHLILRNNPLLSAIKAEIFVSLKLPTLIDLTYTNITCLKNDTLKEMISLRIFNASFGDINKIEFDIFKATGSIEVIDLSHNQIALFLVNNKNIRDVKEIYLSNNKLEQITNKTFLGLTQLQILNLDNNNIVSIDIEAFRTLKSLLRANMGFNKNMMFNPSIFSNLTSLTEIIITSVTKTFTFADIKNTSIAKIDSSSCSIADVELVQFFQIKKLEILILASNKINCISKNAFHKMASLLYLDLSNNMIKYIQPGSFGTTKSLRFLTLHNNNLQSFQFGVFDGMENLENLNLSRNALNSFNVQLFYKNRKLEVIALDDNLISNVDFYAIRNAKLRIVTIGGNPFSCHFLLKFIHYSPTLLVTAENKDFHSENIEGVTCKGDSTTTLKTLLIESVKNYSQATQKPSDSNATVLNNLSHLNTVLYVETCCLIVMMCLFISMCSFILYYKKHWYSSGYDLNRSSSLLSNGIEIEL